ncbi:MAG: hypothetical protein KAQ85_00130 [Thermodesulfovibrionia bacterium]|nr:hypothetical protein [Thermodesulfovibrionia bacterium]
MKTKLGPWTVNAKKWREENGYTTPEWMMYVENRNVSSVVLATITCILGVVLGALSQL